LRLKAHATQSWTGSAGLLSELTDEHARSLVTAVLAESCPVANPQQQLSDIVVRLRNQSIDQRIITLSQQADSPNAGDAGRVEGSRCIQELRRAKAQPLSPIGECSDPI